MIVNFGVLVGYVCIIDSMFSIWFVCLWDNYIYCRDCKILLIFVLLNLCCSWLMFFFLVFSNILCLFFVCNSIVLLFLNLFGFVEFVFKNINLKFVLFFCCSEFWNVVLGWLNFIILCICFWIDVGLVDGVIFCCCFSCFFKFMVVSWFDVSMDLKFGCGILFLFLFNFNVLRWGLLWSILCCILLILMVFIYFVLLREVLILLIFILNIICVSIEVFYVCFCFLLFLNDLLLVLVEFEEVKLKGKGNIVLLIIFSFVRVFKDE